MDTALSLRIAFDKGEEIGEREIDSVLESSELVRLLTTDFMKKPLFVVWRIIALSEIPYSNRLNYTKQIIQYINQYLATPEGFTLSGKETDLLPCYNAMIIEAYSKLGYATTEPVRNAVNWIKKYQPFERNLPSDWNGKGTLKYGGCFKSTPCFIGIAKTVKALAANDKATDGADKEIAELISKGMDYILQHELYKRLSNREPINHHILDLAFPASYQLNIVELLELACLTGNIHRPERKSAIDYACCKQTKDGYWKINYVYKADGYVSFDKKGGKAEWLTYLLKRYMADLKNNSNDK